MTVKFSSQSLSEKNFVFIQLLKNKPIFYYNIQATSDGCPEINTQNQAQTHKNALFITLANVAKYARGAVIDRVLLTLKLHQHTDYQHIPFMSRCQGTGQAVCWTLTPDACYLLPSHAFSTNTHYHYERLPHIRLLDNNEMFNLRFHSR